MITVLTVPTLVPESHRYPIAVFLNLARCGCAGGPAVCCCVRDVNCDKYTPQLPLSSHVPLDHAHQTRLNYKYLTTKD